MRFFIIASLLLMSLLGMAKEMIVQDGASNWSIYLADDAIAAEKTAASQLQAYLHKTSGVILPITSHVDGRRQILVGQSAAAASLLPKDFAEPFSHDEILIAPAEGNLVLAGDRPRGTLYAVFEYIETALGVRFWSATEEYIPKVSSLSLPEKSMRFVPPIQIRAFCFRDSKANHEFAVKRRFYGHGFNIPDEWGGTVTLIGPWHTFDRLLPADVFFQEHPEWFSLVKGKRIGGQTSGQLCLSNLEMRKKLLERVQQELRKATNPEFISISQNDNMSHCECENCKELCRRTGGESGAVIDLVNEICAALHDEFPNVIFQTFAYQYTRHLPTIAPHPQLSPFVCTIERDIARPLTDKNSAVNAGIVKDLSDWGGASRQIDIWDYVTTFSNLLLPLPNLDTTPSDLRLYAANHAHMVMLQGDMFNPGQPGDLQVLKGYVWGKLMWNPDLDPARLETEFVEGYYGVAAPAVKEYLALRRRCVSNLTKSYDCFTSGAPWLGNDALLEGYAILRKAAKAAESDDIISERVNTLAKPFEYMLLTRATQIANRPSSPSASELAELAADWLRFIQRKKITNWMEEWGEAKTLKGIQASLKLKASGASLAFKENDFIKELKAKGKTFHCIEEDAFQLAGGERFGRIIQDNKAANGAAIALRHLEFAWTPKLYYNPPMARGKTYDVYVSIRLEKPVTGTLFQYSAWDGDLKHDVFFNCYFDGAKLNPGSYTYVSAGRLKIPDAGYSFLGCAVRPDVNETYVDHIVLVETENE